MTIRRLGGFDDLRLSIWLRSRVYRHFGSGQPIALSLPWVGRKRYEPPGGVDATPIDIATSAEERRQGCQQQSSAGSAFAQCRDDGSFDIARAQAIRDRRTEHV